MLMLLSIYPLCFFAESDASLGNSYAVKMLVEEGIIDMQNFHESDLNYRFGSIPQVFSNRGLMWSRVGLPVLVCNIIIILCLIFPSKGEEKEREV